MDAAGLKKLLLSVKRLSVGQRVELLAALNAGGHDEEVRSLLELRLTETHACPHCNEVWIVRNGSASGLQRYKCRACRREAGVTGSRGQVLNLNPRRKHRLSIRMFQTRFTSAFLIN